MEKKTGQQRATTSGYPMPVFGYVRGSEKGRVPEKRSSNGRINFNSTAEENRDGQQGNSISGDDP